MGHVAYQIESVSSNAILFKYLTFLYLNVLKLQLKYFYKSIS